MSTTTLEQYLVTMMMTPIIDPCDPRSLFEPGTLWGISTCLEGLSGIGKSKRVTNIGNLIGLSTYCFSGATKQPDDFSGVYVPTSNGLIVECVLPAARSIINKGKGVIFADEVSNMRPAVQAGFLTMIDEKRVGDTPLPGKARILMAMNPPEHAAAGQPISPPMANKMAHYQYPCPTVDEMEQWTLGIPVESPLKGIKDAESLVLSNFYTHWAQVKSLFVGFIRGKRDLRHVQPMPDDPKSSGPWPSPRTWHWAMCAIATARSLSMPRELESEIVGSLVGEAAVTAWDEYAAKANLPDPKEMVKNGWRYDRLRIDVSLSAVTSLTQWVIGLPYKDGVKAALPTWKIFQDIIEDGNADITLTSTKLLIRSKLARKHHGDTALATAAEKVINLLDEKKFGKPDLRDD
jgi:hypothetical protein